jgi:hypothetical protein
VSGGALGGRFEMMLKGEAIRVVLSHVFYADGCAGTTVGLSGGAISLHPTGNRFAGQKPLKFPPRVADTAGKPKSRWGPREPI